MPAQAQLGRGRQASRYQKGEASPAPPVTTMPLTRTRSFAATLVLALAGAPAIGLAPLPAAQGAPGPPPIVHLAATLPRRARPRRRSRYSRVRRLASRSRDWLHAAALTIGPRRQSLRPRLPLRDSYARGPPL